MICPQCNGDDISVIDTREITNGTGTRRRRKCLSCGYCFTTYEYTRSSIISITKRLIGNKLRRNLIDSFDTTVVNAIEETFDQENTDTTPYLSKWAR